MRAKLEKERAAEAELRKTSPWLFPRTCERCGITIGAGNNCPSRHVNWSDKGVTLAQYHQWLKEYRIRELHLQLEADSVEETYLNWKYFTRVPEDADHSLLDELDKTRETALDDSGRVTMEAVDRSFRSTYQPTPAIAQLAEKILTAAEAWETLRRCAAVDFGKYHSDEELATMKKDGYAPSPTARIYAQNPDFDYDEYFL